MRSERFGTNGAMRADVGPGHARGMELRPDLPLSTDKLVGIDLTHIIHTSEVASGHVSAKPGGGGGGGGTSFPNYTSGPTNASAGYNITIEFKGTSWTQAMHDVFVAAADRLTSLILGDLPNITVYGGKGGPKGGG